jgi:RNA recognition motif-containing protein
MRSEAIKDPVMKALFNHEISWADVYSAEDEENWKKYIASGEGAEILAAVQVELDKVNGKTSKKSKGVRWNDDTVKIVETPTGPIQIQKTTTTVLFNPNQVKTIVARNLPRDITEEELHNVFAKHGPVRDVYIPKNLDQNSPYYGTIKGFALIKFMSPTDSTRAYMAETTNLNIRGKMIGIEFAKEDR